MGDGATAWVDLAYVDVADVVDTLDEVAGAVRCTRRAAEAALRFGADAASLPSPPSIPVADDTDVVVDTTTYDNSVTGVGKLTTLVFPTDTVAIAIAIDGDDFPRWLLTTDSNDGLYLGDGTFDPYASTFVRYGGGGRLSVSGAHGVDLVAGDGNTTTSQDLEVNDNTKGVILASPNGTRYRIKVANDGTLSASAA